MQVHANERAGGVRLRWGDVFEVDRIGRRNRNRAVYKDFVLEVDAQVREGGHARDKGPVRGDEAKRLARANRSHKRYPHPEQDAVVRVELKSRVLDARSSERATGRTMVCLRITRRVEGCETRDVE